MRGYPDRTWPSESGIRVRGSLLTLIPSDDEFFIARAAPCLVLGVVHQRGLKFQPHSLLQVIATFRRACPDSTAELSAGYVRGIFWQNLRKRTLAKKERLATDDNVKFDEVSLDLLLFRHREA